jgi:two-component system chemotaxis sensor kinase CheA
MPSDNELLNRLMPVFAAEAQEHLQVISRDLLVLEKQPDGDEMRRMLAEIFRAAHSLKGSARAVSLDSVATLGHSLETLFGRIQRGEFQPKPVTFDRVYQALDTIDAIIQGSTRGELPKVDVAALCASLESIGAETAERPDVTSPVEEATPLVESAPVTTAPIPMTFVPEARHPIAAHSPESVAQAAALTDETVRVATAKLDSLLAQVGELQATRIAADQRLAELRNLVNRVETWEVEWRKVRPLYRNLLSAFEGGAESPPARSNGHVAIVPYAATELRVLFEFLQSNELRLHDTRARVTEVRRQVEADSRRMGQVTSDLQDDVRRTRMMPAAVVFDTFPRVVRDLGRELDREVRLVIKGGETEVDRSVLEQIKAPLLHLLHNAVDHGIEPRERREEAGKPRAGTITLSASQRGGSIVVELADDGAGIDPECVKASALKKGLITTEEAQRLTDQEALWLVFRSGVSTRATITDLSGRGVGLDVVHENVERLQGTIDLSSQLGRGTCISLKLPLTVATTLSLLAEAGGETFGIPLINIVRILGVAPDEIGHAQGRQAIHLDGHPVVLVRLQDTLELSPSAPEPENSRAKKPAILLGSEEKCVAFMVDALVGAQEVVIKSLPHPLIRVRHLTGATILGTGQVVMVLNAADLLRSASRAPARLSLVPPIQAATTAEPSVILIAEDSITTRTLEKNILEASGYQVRTAGDGLEAWNVLQSEGAAPEGAFSLLVSDVNMPRLDGFELTARVRADERLKNLPVILVTARTSREDRERGVQVGAEAYILKNAFDQNTLLATIRQLI